MILSPVISASGKARKRRLMVDHNISLSRDTIRKNLGNTNDIVRNIMVSALSSVNVQTMTIKIYDWQSLTNVSAEKLFVKRAVFLLKPLSSQVIT